MSESSLDNNLTNKRESLDKKSEDLELIERTLSGDKNAFSNIVERYETKVRGYCYLMLRDKTSAEDAAQEIFLKAYRALSKFNHKSTFSTWLYSISSNHCIDTLRKEKVKRLLSFNFSLVSPLSVLPDSVSSSIEGKEMLLKVLHGLSPEYRSLLIMSEAEDLTLKEMAEAFHTSIDSIKSKLKRAKKRALEIKKSIENEER